MTFQITKNFKTVNVSVSMEMVDGMPSFQFNIESEVELSTFEQIDFIDEAQALFLDAQ
jgi:hypothetical protein